MRQTPFQQGRTLRAFAVAVAALVALASNASAKLDIFDDLPIVEAVRKASLADTNKAIIDGAPANARAADGTPVIVLATAARNLDIVTLLVENGARPDDRARKDDTSALTVAAANGDLAIVTYLLDHKASIDLPGALAETALIKAARAHHNDVVKLLLERGADKDETDSSGATAAEIAERAGWKDMQALFTTKKANTK
jgi:ankyrin repeat protein